MLGRLGKIAVLLAGGLALTGAAKTEAGMTRTRRMLPQSSAISAQ